MNRLTAKRMNGIKSGYWSAANKEQLIERLAAYENTGLTPDEIMDGWLMRGWILVENQLPEKDVMILITTISKNGHRGVDGAYYSSDGHWYDGSGGSIAGVIAWTPLPEPWTGTVESKKKVVM